MSEQRDVGRPVRGSRGRKRFLCGLGEPGVGVYRGSFLARFAVAEGELGGRFDTTQCVVRALDELHEQYKGRVFDPRCPIS